MPVTVRGELAQKLISKVDNWQVGMRFILKESSTGKSYEKNGEKKYQTVILLKIFYKIEV